MNDILQQIDSQLQYYSPNRFTQLDGEWRGLLGWPDSYYRWLWSAVSVLQPKMAVEIGRERGVSTLVILDALPEDAEFVSIDINAEARFLEGFYDKRLVQIVDDSLNVPNMFNNIDFLFVDGDHTEKQVIKEWELYKPKLAEKAVVVFDDIHFDEGMTRFWDSITEEKYDISKWHERGFGVVFM